MAAFVVAKYNDKIKPIESQHTLEELRTKIRTTFDITQTFQLMFEGKLLETLNPGMNTINVVTAKRTIKLFYTSRDGETKNCDIEISEDMSRETLCEAAHTASGISKDMQCGTFYSSGEKVTFPLGFAALENISVEFIPVRPIRMITLHAREPYGGKISITMSDAAPLSTFIELAISDGKLVGTIEDFSIFFDDDQVSKDTEASNYEAIPFEIHYVPFPVTTIAIIQEAESKTVEINFDVCRSISREDIVSCVMAKLSPGGDDTYACIKILTDGDVALPEEMTVTQARTILTSPLKFYIQRIWPFKIGELEVGLHADMSHDDVVAAYLAAGGTRFDSGYAITVDGAIIDDKTRFGHHAVSEKVMITAK